MEIPTSLRGLIAKAAQGIKLIPSEKEELANRRKVCLQKRTDVYDQKTAMEEEVRRLESQLLKLDHRRKTEHGVLERVTTREMEAVVVKIDAKEKQLHRAVTAIADLDLLADRLERLAQGQPVTAADWDEVGVDLEDQMATSAEAAKAREQVQGLSERDGRDLAGEVNVEDMLAEIRGPAKQADAATEDLVKQVRARRSEEPES